MVYEKSKILPPIFQTSNKIVFFQFAMGIAKQRIVKQNMLYFRSPSNDLFYYNSWVCMNVVIILSSMQVLAI